MSDKLNCDLSEELVFRELEKSLLEQLAETYAKEKCISDDLLESLFFIYKNPLLEALNEIDKFEQQLQTEKNTPRLLVDPLVAINHQSTVRSRSLVTVVKAQPSGHIIYQVKGSMGINYYLFEFLSFCPCTSFKYNVLYKSEYAHCKHVILVKLLRAMDKLGLKTCTDLELVDFIKQIQ